MNVWHEKKYFFHKKIQPNEFIKSYVTIIWRKFDERQNTVNDKLDSEEKSVKWHYGISHFVVEICVTERIDNIILVNNLKRLPKLCQSLVLVPTTP